MRTFHPQTVRHLAVSTEKLIKLERAGRYEDALASFGEDSTTPGYMPETSHLPEREAADVLLRFGSLLGFYGYKHHVKGGQERSQNVLTIAREQFERLRETPMVAECENYIALAYWRRGDIDEARVWVETAMSHDLANSCDARLYSHVILSMLCLARSEYKQNISNCLAVEADFREHGDAFLNGSICSNIGLSYRHISENADALRYLSLARYFHEKSRHKIYLGTVHNNIALVHKTERRFESALQSADAAIKVYKQLRDRLREASTIDTKAQIYLEARRLPEALEAAGRSITMLRKSEAWATLAESLFTRAKAYLFADDFSAAIENLLEAVDISRRHEGDAAAKRMMDGFAEALRSSNEPLKESHPIDTDGLELIMPASIAHYRDYKGVWIHTSHLESIGISRGDLAIVVPDDVKRGDLVAILEIENDLVTCGYYDAEFGIVCLERDDDDPQLFSENEIRVLGRIVGVSTDGKDATGKMPVREIRGQRAGA